MATSSMNRRLTLLLMFLCSGGCSFVPPMNSAVSMSHLVVVRDVIELAKCEVQDALMPFLGDDTDATDSKQVQFLKTWTAVLKLTLKADQQGNISPTFSLITPLPDVTTATNKFSGLSRTAGLSLNHSETDTSVRTVQFTMDLSNLGRYDCTKAAGAQFGPVRYNSTDPDYNLGIRQWIQSTLGADITEVVIIGGTTKRMKTTYSGSVLEMLEPPQSEKSRKRWKIDFNQNLFKDAEAVQDARNRAAEKTTPNLELRDETSGPSAPVESRTAVEPSVIPFDSLAYSVTFAVVNGGGFTPGWNLRHFKSPVSTSGNLFGLQRTDTNSLDITIAPAKNGTRATEQHYHDLQQLNIQRIIVPGLNQ